MTNQEIQAEALKRATQGQSFANYQSIFDGFLAMGIPAAEILPRENVLTFEAWRALGRVVCKGQHGVKVVTWVPMTRKDETTGNSEPIGRRPKSTTVFHISQTKPIPEGGN